MESCEALSLANSSESQRKMGLTAGVSFSRRESKNREAELEFDKFDRQRRQLEDAQADAQFAQEVEDLAKTMKQLKPPKRKK